MGNCTFYEQQFFDRQRLDLSHEDLGVATFREPCGLNRDQCCEIAHEIYAKGVDYFELDDAGCCLLQFGWKQFDVDARHRALGIPVVCRRARALESSDHAFGSTSDLG